MENINISQAIFIVLGIYELVCGVLSLTQHKVFQMGKEAGMYTDESLREFSRPCGITYILVGIGLILCELLTTELFTIGSFTVKLGWLILIVCGVVGVIVYYKGRKVLVKK